MAESETSKKLTKLIKSLDKFLKSGEKVVEALKELKEKEK